MSDLEPRHAGPEPTTVGVIGAGTMGLGIAIVALSAGHEVVLCETVDSVRDGASVGIARFLDRSVKLGKMSGDERAAAVGRLTTVSELDALGRATVIVEAIYENADLKATTFADLEKVVGADVLFHTNTSTLSVTSIASKCEHPGRVVGTHYCNPAPLMKLVEVVRGHLTTNDAYEQTMSFLRGLGKVCVTTQDLPGFIVNRFLIPFENDCLRAIEAGVTTPADLDAAVTLALGYPMGPCALLDIVGLDLHRAVSMSLYEQLRDPRFAPPPLVDRMIAAGHLGRKTGQGFYTYEDASLFGAS